MIIDRFKGYTVDSLKRDESVLRGILEDAGAVFRGRACVCPLCDDVHASAGLYAPNGDGHRFKCHKCQFNGSVIDVIAKLDGIEVSEVFRRLKGDKARPVRSQKIYPTIEALSQAMSYPVEAIYHYTHPETRAIEMLTFRLKTPDSKTYRPAYPADGGGFHIGISSEIKPLYNRRRLKSAGTVIICEGEGKIHILHKYGFIGTTAPMGAGKAGYADWQPLAGKACILWPDFDEPGRKHMQDVAKILQELSPPCRISLIEPTTLDLQAKEDVVDFVQQLETIGTDKAGIAAAIRAALDGAVSQGGASGLSALLEDTISGKREAIGWPWSSVSNLTKALLPGTVTLIAGGVGGSKSFMLLQAGAYWHEHNIKVAIYELEESQSFHLSRSLAQLSGCSNLTDPDWIRDNAKQSRELFQKHEKFLDGFGSCIFASPNKQPTLPEVAVWIEARAKAGVRIVCIDPITATSHTSRQSWEEDGAFLSSVKRTADAYGCSILLITHPTKTMVLPDVNTLAGGSAYSRFSQTILWLESHNDKTHKVRTACGSTEITHNRSLHLLKVRNGKGQGVRLAFDFDTESLTLHEKGTIVREQNK